MKEKETGMAERGFGIVRNIGLVGGLLGLLSANPTLLFYGAGGAVLGEAGRRNRQQVREKST